jgi:hypothetical protein
LRRCGFFERAAPAGAEPELEVEAEGGVARGAVLMFRSFTAKSATARVNLPRA